MLTNSPEAFFGSASPSWASLIEIFLGEPISLGYILHLKEHWIFAGFDNK
jgi:hypothetical protein